MEEVKGYLHEKNYDPQREEPLGLKAQMKIKTMEAHGSLGVRPGSQRLLVQAELWSLDAVYCAS